MQNRERVMELEEALKRLADAADIFAGEPSADEARRELSLALTNAKAILYDV